jgi:hypothetical protein
MDNDDIMELYFRYTAIRQQVKKLKLIVKDMEMLMMCYHDDFDRAAREAMGERYRRDFIR